MQAKKQDAAKQEELHQKGVARFKKSVPSSPSSGARFASLSSPVGGITPGALEGERTKEPHMMDMVRTCPPFSHTRSTRCRAACVRLAAWTQETGATLAKEGRLDGKTSPHIVGEMKLSRASPDQLHDGIVTGGAGSAGGDGPAPAAEELHVDEDGGGKRKGRSPPSKSSSLHGIN